MPVVRSAQKAFLLAKTAKLALLLSPGEFVSVCHPGKMGTWLSTEM